MITKKETKHLPYALTAIDIGVILLAFSVSLYVRFSTSVIPISVPQPDVPGYLVLVIGVLPVWWVNLAYFRLYNSQFILHGNDEYRRIINAATMATLHTMVIIYLLKVDFARGWVLLSWATAIIFLLAGRFAHRRLHRLLARRSGRSVPVLLIGANREAKTLADQLLTAGDMSGYLVGALAWPSRKAAEGLEVLGEVDDVATILHTTKAEAAIVVPSALPASALQGLYHKLAKAGVAVYISPSLFEIVASRAAVLPISDVPLIRLQAVEFSGLKYAVKRTTDIIGATILLVLLAPLFLVLSAIIKLQSPGPVLFKQERVGRHKRRFMMYKFRTMVPDAEAKLKELMHLNEATGPIFKIKDDPRLIGIGRWLRKYSLDELPQLINVFIGQMSLVGPRPPIPSEVEKYGDWEMRRLEVNPGMTGLWQVRGRSDTTFEEMIRLDLYYIENWSPTLDSYILLKTANVVLSGKGAY